MSTIPRPPRVENAPKEACIVSGNSMQSSVSHVIAAKIARVPKRRSGRSSREDGNAHPQQLSLTFEPPSTSSPPRSQSIQKTRPAAERFASLDQRMTTTDVLRVVGVNRSTIFRWVKREPFRSVMLLEDGYDQTWSDGWPKR